MQVSKAMRALAVLTLLVTIGPVAHAQTQSDGQIVANERVGQVRLGHTLSEVVATLGQPSNTIFLGPQEAIATYCSSGGDCNSNVQYRLSISTWGPRNEVYRITVGREGNDLATPEGVRVGMSELDVRLRMGNPQGRVWHEAAEKHWLLYRGLLVMVDRNGVVTHIDICQPRYQRRLRSDRLWCY